MTVSAAARYHDRLKRKRLAIKIRQGQLSMEDADYRALLQRAAGVTSSIDLMTQEAADAVLTELQRLGAPAGRPQQRVNEWRFVFRLTGERQALCKKIFRCAEKIGAKQNEDGQPMSKAWVEGIVLQAQGFKAAGVAGKVAKPLETCAPDELMTIIQILESRAWKIGA